MSSINTNTAAMTALQSLTHTNKMLTETQGHISTGLRVSEAPKTPPTGRSPRP